MARIACSVSQRSGLRPSLRRRRRNAPIAVATMALLSFTSTLVYPQAHSHYCHAPRENVNAVSANGQVLSVFAESRLGEPAQISRPTGARGMETAMPAAGVGVGSVWRTWEGDRRGRQASRGARFRRTRVPLQSIIRSRQDVLLLAWPNVGSHGFSGKHRYTSACPNLRHTTWRPVRLLRQLRRFSWEGEPRLSVRTSVRNVRSRPRFPAEPTDLTAPEEAQLKQVFAGGGAKHLEPRRIFDETIARTR